MHKRIAIKKISGFTLIEILVSVAIIGILATIIVFNVLGSTAKARDAKRKEDITTINKALGMYRIDNHKFPYDDCINSSGVDDGYCFYTWQVIRGAETCGTGSTATNTNAGWVTTPQPCDPAKNKLLTALTTYLGRNIPTDPINGVRDNKTYYYIYNTTTLANYAYLKVYLETERDGNYGNGKCFGFASGDARWEMGSPDNWSFGGVECGIPAPSNTNTNG